MPGSAERCISCGYDLSATPAGSMCPECGRPAHTQRDALDHAAVTGRRGRWIAAAILTLGLLCIAAICSGAFSSFF